MAKMDEAAAFLMEINKPAVEEVVTLALMVDCSFIAREKLQAQKEIAKLINQFAKLFFSLKDGLLLSPSNIRTTELWRGFLDDNIRTCEEVSINPQDRHRERMPSTF